ncbi:MAG: sulfur carrier protein ThiS [Halanaerobiaceae bacterium]
MLEDKDLNLARVIFVLNDNVIDKKGWKSINLQEEDNIEILKFVGGG